MVNISLYMFYVYVHTYIYAYVTCYLISTTFYYRQLKSILKIILPGIISKEVRSVFVLAKNLNLIS